MSPVRPRAAALLLGCTLAFAVTTVPASPAGATDALPPVTAAAWLVADLDTGQIVAAKDPHRRLAPASTLKALTLLALSPSVPVGSRTAYSATDADASIDGSKVGLVPTSKYRPIDLYHGLMLGSGNDCAHALAEIAGGQEASVALMAAEAQRLGAIDTTVRNTSGLDAKGQVSTAYDLALFGREVLERPDLAKLVRTTSYPFPSAGKSFGAKRKTFQIQNHNRLLRNYDGALGIKNGYTVAAGGSFIGAARRDGHAYVVTVLKAKGSTWHMTRDLLDWAFANGDTAVGQNGAQLGHLLTPQEVEQQRSEAGGPDSPAGQDGDAKDADDAVDGGQDSPVRALAASTAGPADLWPAPAGPTMRVGVALVALAVLFAGLYGFGRRRAGRLGPRGVRHGA